MTEPMAKKPIQSGSPLYVRIFCQYLLLVFMIFLVISASGIVIWTSFFLPEDETSLQSEEAADIISLVRTRDVLVDWLKTSPEVTADLPENQVLSADVLIEDIQPPDLKNYEGLRWLLGRDRVGLENLSGDNIQVFIEDFYGNEFHLYDGWVLWCPIWESNCYFQLVKSENLIDFTTIKLVRSD